MNILVLNGSPKGEKSNTYRITKAFLNGIKTGLGENDNVEEIDISASHIEHCKGCFCCWTATPGKCVIRDDMDIILPKIINSDLVIWSFPIYYFGMPSKLKALLDRHLPTLLPFIVKRSDGSYVHSLREKCTPPGSVMLASENVLISSGGLGMERNNFEALFKQFDILCDGKFTKIVCPQGEAFSHVDIDRYLSCVEQAGREYVLNRCFSEQTAKQVNATLYSPEAYVEMADASWDIVDETNNLTQLEKDIQSAERFTKQMAATYNPRTFDGTERVFEIYYTDLKIGYQLIMGKNKCDVRSADFTPYTTRVETPLDVWQDISEGKYSGEQAMMEGKYKTLGDLKLLISWGRYFCQNGFDTALKTPPDKKTEKKTNMTLMIATWFVIWTLLTINPIIGGIAGIATAVCIHFANLKWELTIYDYISCFCVSGFSLLALLGFNMQIIVPLSYLSFGIMWLASCITKVPITAYYSKNEYNGDDALRNPLFLKTNRILTICWGVLYLVTPIWTYYIMGSSVPYLTALANTICPIFMGIFTAWFQKWYPAKIARGGGLKKQVGPK